ncbi:MAG TPA: hypothetical protein VLQ91_05305 [Draconibacterium sp.]|nr:hypothetical protein [Draconibacterium sp.]
MKKLLPIILIFTLLLAGCSGDQSKENNPAEKTHQHEDGSVHESHEEEKQEQEEFSVSADTLSIQKQTESEHTHDGTDQPHTH